MQSRPTNPPQPRLLPRPRCLSLAVWRSESQSPDGIFLLFKCLCVSIAPQLTSLLLMTKANEATSLDGSKRLPWAAWGRLKVLCLTAPALLVLGRMPGHSLSLTSAIATHACVSDCDLPAIFWLKGLHLCVCLTR